MAAIAAPATTALVPKPNNIVSSTGYLTLPSDTIIAAPEAARAEALFLQNWLGGGPKWMTQAHQSGIRFTIDASEARALGGEGYRLDVDQVGARITSATTAGAFYGAETLRQLAQVSDSTISIPCVRITDGPRFPWRGLMLDCSRHFWSVDFIQRLLDSMATLKLNRFHWHLSDDQGWRLQILKYPKLTDVGSTRAGTKGRGFVSDGIPYGGFYSQNQVRDIVAYAAQRHIEVVPEIEMPGHCTAALAAYPEYSCAGLPLEVGQRWGGYPDIFCAGQDKTFEFLKDILEEVMDLFPSRYIHVGGDEVPKDRWLRCPKCRARMELEGFKDVDQLQSYFIKRIDNFLSVRGHKLLGWDEILEGGLASNATVMSWRGRKGGLVAAKQGHDVIMSPSEYCYLDHYQADPRTEPPANGGSLPLQQVYSFEPVPDSLSAPQSSHILGLQGNLWTEYIDSNARAEYMIFPRLVAIAEIGWTRQGNRDFADFIQRLPGVLKLLDAEGVRYRPIDNFVGRSGPLKQPSRT